ncbi:MAG: hypothetical protein K6G71_10055, partial [Clostridiales bacterium]|nr:hypothetical protein [Clostridiales bacterium]
MASRTEAEIRAFVWDHPAAKISASDAYATAPVLEAPYSPGTLSAEALQAALNAVNQLRFTAGVSSDVTLDNGYNEQCQAGALINAVNGSMSHHPSQPEGMRDELYDLGYLGTSSSNIAWGYSSLVSAVNTGWIHDGDSSNVDRLGHRRWLLHPAMKEIGFGQVGAHTAMYAFDGFYNNDVPAEVAWPAQKMPVDWMYTDLPWSVSFGKELDGSQIAVTVTRGSDGATWSFSGASADGAFYVNNEGYGQPGCVIFRPDGISYNAGDHFDVRITGAASETVAYSVDLFDIGSRPVITAQPKNVSVAEGKTASVTITATGDELTYQWYAMDPGDTKYYLSSNKTATYKAVMTSEKNGRKVYCVVTDKNGNSVTSDTATITIVTKPVITAQPKNVSVNTGGKASFKVTATGANSYQWQKSADGGNSWAAFTATSTATTANLKFNASAANARYLYRCKITNAAGSKYSSKVYVTLTDAAPIIRTQPKNVSVKTGEKASFTVTAPGTASYQWQKSTDGGKNWTAFTATATATTANLKFNATASNAKYLYRCAVTNSGGAT